MTERQVRKAPKPARPLETSAAWRRKSQRGARSVSRRESKGEEVVRKSSLINCEVWSANAESKRFALLKKGQLVVISGYIKPENYTDRNGVEQSCITFVCTSVASPSTEKKPKAKVEKPAEAVAEEVPF